MIEPGLLDTLDEFEESRRLGIGATDAAAILGVSPWKTLWDVWSQKVEPPQPQSPPSLVMKLGLLLQDAVGNLYSEASGLTLRRVKKQVISPMFPWLRCHLDFRVRGDAGHLVEAKTTTRWDEWGPQPAEGVEVRVPLHYWIQVQHEMAVTSAQLATIATLFSLKDFRWYDIPRDNDFIGKLLEAEQEVWEKYVVPKVPPPVDGSTAARKFLGRRHPKDDGVLLPATPEQGEVVERLRHALLNQAQINEEVDRLKNKIIEAIGPHKGLRGGDFEVRYPQIKEGQPQTAWSEVAAVQRRLVEEIHARGAEAVIATLREFGFDMTVEDALGAIEELYQKPGKAAYRRWDFQDKKGTVE